jgi:hypothetical protein
MKIKTISFLILILVVSDSYSQLTPESYYLQKDKRQLTKVSSPNPTSNSITDIITIGDTVWLGTSRGVSVSFDRGETWTNFYGTGPFGEEGITAISYYKGMVWAATVTSVDAPGGGTVPKGTGLKYTTDNGNNWSAIPQPLDDPTDTTQIFGANTFKILPVTVAEQNVTYDIAFTPGTVWITSFAGGLRKSTDMGVTWQRVLLPTDSLNSISPADTLSGINLCISPAAGNFCGHNGWLNYRAFSVIAVNDSTLYVGTANGINKSTDNGISWIKLTHQNQVNSISGNFIVALGHDSLQSDDEIWAATWRAEDNQEFYGVSSTSDGGQNWNTFLKDERVHNFGFKSSQVIAPSDNGAFRTSNQGVSWILPNSIIDERSQQELSTPVFFSASSHGRDVWLGSDDGLVKLNENAGSFWNGEWKIFFASLPLESANDTYCYPNPFSPRQEMLKIKYTTGGENKKVTIIVLDFAMNVVRTVIQNADRIKTLDDAPDRWDGRDENGNIVPNGVYFYRVEAGDDEPVFGKIIVLQ